jgi:hypothetical protein
MSTGPGNASRVQAVDTRVYTRVPVAQTVAATLVLAAANATRKHKIVGGCLTMSVAGTMKFTDGAGDLTGAMVFADGGGFVWPAGAVPYIQTTVVNSALSIVTTTGAARGFLIILTE